MFYTRYNPPKSVTTVLDTETKLVDQSEADVVGLAYQMKRFGMDGLLARFEQMKANFGYADTRAIPSYAELSQRIAKGTEYFNQLPSEIRRQFGDKPENFYEYLESNPVEACEKGYVSDVYAKDILRLHKEQQAKEQQANVAETVQPVADTVEPQPIKNDEVSA